MSSASQSSFDQNLDGAKAEEFRRFTQALLARDFSARLDLSNIASETERQLGTALNSLADEMNLMLRSHKKIENDFQAGRQQKLAVVDDASATELKVLESQLAYLAKMSSLGEMAGAIVHEVNNPLAVMQGKARQILRAIEKPSPDPALIRRHVEAIEAASERILKIMQSIRAFSRDGTQCLMAKEKVSKIIKDTLGNCSARFSEAGVDLRGADVAGDLVLECRPAQIGQVLFHLLNNAMDAVGGQENAWTSIEVVDQGDCVGFQVTDSGNGIPEEIAEKIFKPFFSTKSAGHGTGMGLGIASAIIAAHGGTLIIDRNCPNTRFVASLPKSQTSVISKSA